MYVLQFDDDPLQALEKRYYQNDNTLTSEEITTLRTSMSVDGWHKLQRAQAANSFGVTPISAGRSEAQIAADYRARTLELLEPMVNLITEARKDHSMTITFGITPPDAFGRCSISMLEITKKLC